MFRTILSLTACAALVPASFAAEQAEKPADPAAASTTAKPVKLGKIKIDGIGLTIDRVGDLVEGKDLVLELVPSAKTAAPKSIQVWVAGTVEADAMAAKDKVAATAGKDGHWAATVKLPAKLDKATTLWLSVEPATGKPGHGSLALVHG